MQLEWQGSYLDGKTAARQQATIHLTPKGLQVTTASSQNFFWPYEEIRQTQGFFPGEQIRLEIEPASAEALLLAEQGFLTTLHRFAPELTRHFHNPKRRRLRAPLIFICATATVGIATALYLWGIPAMAALVAARVPVSWEERLGAAVVDQLAPPEKRCADPAGNQRINEIVTTLTAPLGKSPYVFKVIVVDESVLNAFAAPGGYIVLFRGLLEKTQTAEELAGVLAHELQHILERHATRALLQYASTGLVLAALTGDVSGLTAFGLETARTLATLHYSRQQEEEADLQGLKMLLAAGVDPAGMISLFETMGKEQGKEPQIFTYLASHPSTEDRIERLRLLVKDSPRPRRRLLPDHPWQEMKKICRAHA